MKKLLVILTTLILVFNLYGQKKEQVKDYNTKFWDNPVNYINLFVDPEEGVQFSLFDLTSISLLGIKEFYDIADTTDRTYVLGIDVISTELKVDILLVIDKLDGHEFYNIRDGGIRNITFIYNSNGKIKALRYFPNAIEEVFHQKFQLNYPYDYKAILELFNLNN